MSTAMVISSPIQQQSPQTLLHSSHRTFAHCIFGRLIQLPRIVGIRCNFEVNLTIMDDAQQFRIQVF